MKTIVFGYSANKEKYSNMAYDLLRAKGHDVVGVNPRNESELQMKQAECHTLTLYVSSEISDKYQDILINYHPKRVIFNPGSENPKLQNTFETLGVDVIHGCTLVMLRTEQF